MNKLDKIEKSYLKLLLADLNIIEVLSSINIENIEDHTTKVICRTIMGSVETLHEHLNTEEIQEASISN